MPRERNASKTDAARAAVFRLRGFAEADSAESQRTAHAAAAQSDVTMVLGRARMTPAEASKLQSGSLIVLAQETTDPVDIFSGGRLLGRGQVVVIDDKFCVRVVELNAAGQAA